MLTSALLCIRYFVQLPIEQLPDLIFSNYHQHFYLPILEDCLLVLDCHVRVLVLSDLQALSSLNPARLDKSFLSRICDLVLLKEQVIEWEFLGYCLGLGMGLEMDLSPEDLLKFEAAL